MAVDQISFAFGAVSLITAASSTVTDVYTRPSNISGKSSSDQTGVMMRTMDQTGVMMRTISAVSLALYSKPLQLQSNFFNMTSNECAPIVVVNS